MQQLQEEGAEATFDLKPHLQDYYIRHLQDNTFVSWLAILCIIHFNCLIRLRFR